MLRTNVLLITAAAILGVTAPEVVWAQEQSPPDSTGGPQQIEMVVHGLSCPFCAYGLEKKLNKIEGLDSVSIDFRTGKVFLLVRDGSRASDERLRQLVSDAGFEVVEIRRSARGRTPS